MAITVAAAGVQPRVRRVQWSIAPWLFLGPACAFFTVLFVLPICKVLILSVTDPTVSLVNYKRVFSVSVYLKVLINTVTTALIVTIACLLLAYPLAYVMAGTKNRLAVALLAVVTLSFWSGFLVRTYAWLVIFGVKGPIAAAFAALGIAPAPQLIFTSFSSIVAMTHILLPYMVLALYGVMRRIDPSHMVAAASLGASPVAAFRCVYLPLSLPGIVSGCILVFTLCVGFFVTPVLLGSPQDMMISQLINQQIEELLAWGFASTLAVVLLFVILLIMAVYNRFAGLDRLWG
jgi:putative spermidine/putrescine transport system permease protein